MKQIVPKRSATYANYLRVTPRERLSQHEARMLQADLDWCAANPGLQNQLDALIGKIVYLKRNHATIGGKIVHVAGMRLLVLERWKDKLHVIAPEGTGTILSVRPDWVSDTPSPKLVQ